ncbi:MAG: hypothetical protein K2M65_07265 [Muribaculaceae bacterium]|nr:hypothetical protein [Muribaculaceae bacterium]
MSEKITTSVYQTGAHTYMRAVAEMWLGRWWWIMIVPVGVCFVIGATVNVAFAFIGFMAIFLLVPMIIMFLFFTHALTPEASMAILPHEVTTSDTGLDVTFVTNDETNRQYPPVHIDWNDVRSLEWRSNDIMLHLKGTPYRFLLIPYDAIGDAKNAFSAICRRHIKTDGFDEWQSFPA